MKTRVWPRPLITPLIVVFVAAHLTATVLAQRGEIRPANVLGPANAPVTIEFFGDLQCPQCARYEPTIKSVLAEFGDKVRMVYRHLPLNTHEHAELAACATEAAANQGKFWQMAEALYKTQWMWANAPAPRTVLMDKAKELGLDLDQFQQDLDKPESRLRVAADQAYAASLGVKNAPSAVINGYSVPNSEFNENGFRAAIKAALAKASQ